MYCQIPISPSQNHAEAGTAKIKVNPTHPSDQMVYPVGQSLMKQLIDDEATLPWPIAMAKLTLPLAELFFLSGSSFSSEPGRTGFSRVRGVPESAEAFEAFLYADHAL